MDPCKERTIEHFNEQWGRRYVSLSWFCEKDFVAHLLRCTNTIAGDWLGKTCFEGGCGNGRNSRAALSLGVAHLTSTDIADQAVLSAFENNKDFVSRLRCYPADLADLHQEQDGTYDISFSVNCILHIPDYEKAVAELVRITKVGGLVLVNVPPVKPPLVKEVDDKIREYTTRMRPDDLQLFSEVLRYLASKDEIYKALHDKMHLPRDILSIYDHFGLPYKREITPDQITNVLRSCGCEIVKIDERVAIQARKGGA